MAIVTTKELEARRAAKRVADAAQTADAAAATSLPNTEVSQPAARVPPGRATSPRINPVVPAASEVDDADEPLVAEPVGYCRPPLASQFRTGDGRPRGPAKGSRRPKSLSALHEKWLSQLTTVRVGRKTVRITRLERMMLIRFDKAEKGDYRSLRDVLDRYDAAFPDKAEAQVARPELTATDEATLDAFRAQIMSGLSKK